MATKRKTSKKKSVVDSAVRNAAILSDGCNPELVKGAEFVEYEDWTSIVRND